MAEIVGSLFGVDPQQLMQQRQAIDNASAFRYAQLDPLEQAKMSLYQGGAGLARGVGGLLGGDAEMQKASKIQQLASQFDLSTPQGAREFGRALQPFAPVESMKALTKADAMETMAVERGLKSAQTTKALRERTIPTSPLGKLQFERQELLDAGFSPNDPRVLAYDDAIKATGIHMT